MSRRGRALDLFCGAGGASMGLHRAGFDVTGVDLKEQPNYPFTFIQADAMTFPLGGFDFVWASPPCQFYMQSGMVDKEKHPDLVPAVRKRFERLSVQWIIENVPGAPLRRDAFLGGSMFGLGVRRHRIFEMEPSRLTLQQSCDHSKPAAGVYGHPHGKAGAWPGMLPSTLPVWRDAMGIDWMTAAELSQAIPPAYSEFLASVPR